LQLENFNLKFLFFFIAQLMDDSWIELTNGTSIGHKKIDAIYPPIEVKTLSLMALQFAETPMFDFFGAYLIAQ
jgi:hypothetical protein